MAADRLHYTVTRVGGLAYLFTAKHHGGGHATDARWADDVTADEEFSVFDEAVARQVADDRGWVYGVLPAGDELRDLGTWQQQVAEFPATAAGVPWHGYPIWAAGDAAPENRRGERMRPSKAVFLRLREVELISERQRKRLIKGDHA